MTALPVRQPVSMDEYLAGELTSDVKHEYVAGMTYAMAGARNVHNLIAGNIFASLHAALSGGACRPFNSDTKMRLRFPTHTRFYYPDVSVICRPNPQTDSFQDEPLLLVEVISPDSRRIDEGEKKDAYFSISSLDIYLLVEQDSPDVVVHRRGENGFDRVLVAGMDGVVALPELKAELTLASIYDGVVFLDSQ